MLRLRGLRFRARDETQVSAEDLTRIDLCWSAVAGLSVIDPILGADFQTRGLLLALRAGEPFRIARSIAMEAANRATGGIRAASRVAIAAGERPRDLACGSGFPQAPRGSSPWPAASALLLGQWKQARGCFDHGESLLRDHCTGVTWERDTVRNLALWALLHMGKIGELKRRWSLLIKEAQECGDRYAATTLTTFYMATIRLADDDPERHRRRAGGGDGPVDPPGLLHPAFHGVSLAHAPGPLSRSASTRPGSASMPSGRITPGPCSCASR